MVLDLIALPGPGYVVADEGKSVTIPDPAAPPSAIQMALVASFPGYTSGDDTYLFSTQGVIVSSQSQGGALMHAVLTAAMTPPFNGPAFSNGKPQDLNGDGMGDVGRTGAPSGTPPVWVSSGGATADWLRPSQDAQSPTHAGPGSLTHLLLENIVLSPTLNPLADTAYNFIPRSGAGNHTWRERSVGANGIPTVGAPVEINVIPEPSTVLLLVMCGLGLAVGYLRRKG
jgi:hypothetical protein